MSGVRKARLVCGALAALTGCDLPASREEGGDTPDALAGMADGTAADGPAQAAPRPPAWNDLLPPTLAIDAPADRARVDVGAIELRGSAVDEDAGSRVAAVTISIDGGAPIDVEPVAPGDWSSFSIDLALGEPGQRTLTAVARDRAGNRATASITVEVLPPLLFWSSFETGDESEWTRSGDGRVSGGAYVGDERARTGDFALVAYNDPTLPGADAISAKLSRWRFPYPEAYFSAWFYWPEDYVVAATASQYVNFFEFKEASEPYDPLWILAVMYSPLALPDHDQFALHDPRTGEVYWTDVAVPKGRWFSVEAYRRPGTSDGELAFWIDGVPLLRMDGIDTDGRSATPGTVAWGVGNYGGATGRAIYVDDAAVSSVQRHVE